MKKIVIIAAILLTSAVTAWSISSKENKADVKIENSDFVGNSSHTVNASLATAD